ncbi:CKLF-like MARVEL transmembrane domain-containing protein 2 [Eulemur rufifrons]|uniref:CKLF-like MARVEL transmembrane domain-containing protein 2 n=1 Tax=Eulemur rufifrons TaxID=859984 RepID=UPI003743F945
MEKLKGKAPPPPPTDPKAKPPEKKPGEGGKDTEQKTKSVQPKDEVGTRKGCRRYRWLFKDSNKEFWTMGHAEVKILSLGCLIASLVSFSSMPVHPFLPLVITMEICILSFFIIIYTFAINRYIPFILWPVSDLLNDVLCFCFLMGAVVFAVRIRSSLPTPYLIGLIFMGMAGLFALIDIYLQRNHFRGKKIQKNVLVSPEKENAPGAAKAPEAAKPPAGAPAPAAPAKEKGK